tara:strand:+ start:661 stop:816 length:156 start_codon:yes stop_codon:yes gene_type:complete
MQVGQDSINGILFFNASDNPDSTSAAGANLDVYVEYSLESLGLGHCMTLDR